MFQLMIKKGDKFVHPKDYHKSLTDEHMNGDCDRPQARRWKVNIKHMMKSGMIPKSPVAIQMNKLELMKQKIEKKKKKEVTNLKENEMVPVVEGEDPLAVI